MDRTLNLSSLQKLLHDTLLATERVKAVLRKNCEEAAFALKPWPVKIVERRDKCSCNCKKVAIESEVVEIAAGIDKAINLAQDLREKVKLDVAPQRKLSRRSPIGKARPAPPAASGSGGCGKNAPRSNMATCGMNVTKSVGGGSSPTAVQSGAVTSAASRNTTDKKRSQASSARGTAKPKGGRNFILENKLNVKKISSLNKPQTDARRSNGAPQASKRSLPPAASAPELSGLIRRMAQKFTEGALASSSDGGETNSCTLHDGNQLVERTIMVDAAEALRHFKLPREIVRASRASHALLEKTDTSNSNIIEGDRATESVDNFLREFEEMNTSSVQESSEEMSPLVELARESIILFSDIFTGKLDSTRLGDVQNWIRRSETVLKPHDTESVVEDRIIERAPCDLPLTREWMSNGVWNVSCVKYFKCFFEANRTRYDDDEKQLSSLYETMQQLQRTEHLITLIRTILRDVIPAIKSNIDPESAEYARAYKTMLVLCQGLNPEMPVLVRNDS